MGACLIEIIFILCRKGEKRTSLALYITRYKNMRLYVKKNVGRSAVHRISLGRIEIYFQNIVFLGLARLLFLYCCRCHGHDHGQSSSSRFLLFVSSCLCEKICVCRHICILCVYVYSQIDQTSRIQKIISSE